MNFQFFYGLAFNPFEKGIDVKHIFESHDFKQFSSRMEYFKSTKGFACILVNLVPVRLLRYVRLRPNLIPNSLNWSTCHFPR